MHLLVNVSHYNLALLDVRSVNPLVGQDLGAVQEALILHLYIFRNHGQVGHAAPFAD